MKLNSAVLMPGFIGDFILALSVVIKKAQNTDEKLTLIIPQHLIPLSSLITSLPYFPYRRGSRSELITTVTGVKRQSFDKLYMLSESFSAVWFGVRTGISNRRALHGNFFQSLIPRNDDVAMHITKEYANVLEIEYSDPSSWIGIPLRVQSIYKNNIIVLCPGVGHAVTGRWHGFRELVKLLPSYEFVILGSNEDAEAAKKIASHLPHRVHDNTGKTSIESAAAVISSSSVVISNHCGLMYLAGFLGVPVVGIFGSSSPVRYRPLGQAVRCAVPEIPCTKCNGRTCTRDRHYCLDSISPSQVLSLAGEIVRKDE